VSKPSWAAARWVRPLVSVMGMVVLFYVVPVGNQQSASRTIFALLLTLGAVCALGWAIVSQLKRQLLHPGDENLRTLLMLLGSVAVVFALGYFLLEVHDPGQMVGVSTRTDALYFTIATLTTVGYGDVHAQGQAARVLVSLQLVFDVIFVAALVSTVARSLSSKAEARRQTARDAVRSGADHAD
jgi:hypothetical protein